MKSFRFRGERLLEWRRVQADAARVAFVRANESAREAATRLADADDRRQQAQREYCRAMDGTFEAGSLERYRNWIAARQSEVIACGQLHQQRLVSRGKAADHLKQADRNQRVLERLRDRAWRRYVDYSRRAEMKELDALATLQFTRRMTERGSHNDR